MSAPLGYRIAAMVAGGVVCPLVTVLLHMDPWWRGCLSGSLNLLTMQWVLWPQMFALPTPNETERADG